MSDGIFGLKRGPDHEGQLFNELEFSFMENPINKIRSRYYVGGRDLHLLSSPTDKVFSLSITMFKKDKPRFI